MCHDEHHSRPGTAGEIHHILPVLAGLSADEVTTEGQDHHTAAYKRLALPNSTFHIGKVPSRTFARRFGLADSERAIANMMPRTEESAGQKIFLPWRSNESRFAPQQYYYAAFKKCVVPSWAISAAVASRLRNWAAQLGGYGHAKRIYRRIGDTLFAVAWREAIGLSAAILPIQRNKEWAASDAGAANQKLGHFAHLPRSPNTQITDVDKTCRPDWNF